MKNVATLYDIFVGLLREIFDAENQILEALPKIIKTVKNAELKKGLTNHLKETNSQVQRLKTIFSSINENPTGQKSLGMEGILAEGDAILKAKYPPVLEDVALVAACQKVEHYEIAAYGTLFSLAEHLEELSTSENVDYQEICQLLNDTLEEEKNADETLTSVAEGGFFNSGINDQAVKFAEEHQTASQSASHSQSHSSKESTKKKSKF